MEAAVDPAGRILIPKKLREAIGLTPGMKVDIAWYGQGLQITIGGRTARLVEADGGRLVAESSTPITDDDMYALMDAGRR